MEQKIERAEAFGDISNLTMAIQKKTSLMNREGFKLTDVSSIEASPNGSRCAILVFTKE